jgi:mono/diheme cytochrome c family protein
VRETQLKEHPIRWRPILDRTLMRPALLPHLLAASVLLGAAAAAFADDIDHGRRLAERWCAACHATGEGPTKFNRGPPLAAHAARQDVTSEMIASFLLLPHATMASPPLSRQDAQDLAAFIMDMRK